MGQNVKKIYTYSEVCKWFKRLLQLRGTTPCNRVSSVLAGSNKTSGIQGSRTLVAKLK